MAEMKIPFPGNSPTTRIFLAKYENDPNVTVVYVNMQAQRALRPEPIQEIEPKKAKNGKK